MWYSMSLGSNLFKLSTYKISALGKWSTVSSLSNKSHKAHELKLSLVTIPKAGA